MKVFIVEDEMLIAKATKFQLEQNGFEVTGVAYNSESFWRSFQEIPDVVLMDIKLKRNESGVELAKEIRSKHEAVHIIFTTGNSLKLTEKEIESIKYVGILSKPIVYQDLFERIRSKAVLN